MIPASFDYLAPKKLDEALMALQAHGDDAKLLAGGHSLLPLMKLRLASPKLLVDLRRIAALRTIEQRGDAIIVGALVTHHQIESSALLKKICPLLPETAREIGDVQVRNRGTLGGSVAHADLAGDWPAALLALRAKLKVVGVGNERMIAAENFFLGPLTTALGGAEILTEIHFPVAAKRSGFAYAKMAQQASGFAIVGVAVALQLDAKGNCQEIGVGVTGLSDQPFPASRVEERLRGGKLTAKGIEAAAALVAEGVEALEDLNAAADYRAHLARVYTGKAIQMALRRAR